MQENERPQVMPSFKQLEQDGWHDKASFYDERAGRLTREATQHLLDAVAIQPGMRLLDVCCGPGYGAGEASARGVSACGIDIAPGMIEEARQRYPKAEFRQGDAEALGFPDDSFDAVICPFGILHLGEPERAIAEAFRVLKPEGRYAFSVWCTPEKAELLGMALKVITGLADMNVPLPPAPSFFHFSDPAVARASLERAGFADMFSEEVPITYRGNITDDVWDWFEKSTVRTMALVRLQTPEIQARIKDGIVRAAALYQSADGITIPCPAVLYCARKPSA